jgi:hypothetical protein
MVPDVRIRHIHWSSWGSAQAVGSGISEYVAPGQIGAEGRPESARVVLFHLGCCRERRAYDAVEWYFPQHGQHFRLRTYIDSCTGQYRELVPTPAPTAVAVSPTTEASSYATLV